MLLLAGIAAGWVALSAPSRSAKPSKTATASAETVSYSNAAVTSQAEETQKLNQRRTTVLQDYLDRRSGNKNDSGNEGNSDQVNPNPSLASLSKVIIMTSVACNGCPEKIIAALENIFAQKPNSRQEYLIITTPENNLPNFPCASILDSDYEIERYNFESAGGCAIVDIQQGDIQKCQSVNVNNNAALLASLN